jgi:hypothetical protein
VLPDIEADDRLALDAGDGLAHEGAVLVRGRADRELLVGRDVEPRPAGAEAGAAALRELLLELVERAEGRVDRGAEAALRGAALAGPDDRPEEGVVAVAARVVAQAGADGLGTLERSAIRSLTSSAARAGWSARSLLAFVM